MHFPQILSLNDNSAFHPTLNLDLNPDLIPFHISSAILPHAPYNPA